MGFIWKRSNLLSSVYSYVHHDTHKTLLENLVFQSFRSSHRSPQPATLLKKRLWQRCFPVNFAKFLRTPFLKNAFG